MMRAPTVAVTLALFALPAGAKDPAAGATTFTVYEAFMSPAQEPGEESETPKALQKSLGATAPSTDREKRASRGHGQIRFARDLSKAYVDVTMTGVDPANIVMFHIHCGPPGFLGPVVVDLGESGELSKTVKDGKLTVELTNKNVKFVKHGPPGLKPALPESCPIEIGLPAQVNTLAGLEWLARKGVLYFNLHTKAHTYYGEMRGQIYAVREESSGSASR
jgi:hypothetical protein